MDAIAVPAAGVRSWLHCPARAEPRNISWLGKGAAAAAAAASVASRFARCLAGAQSTAIENPVHFQEQKVVVCSHVEPADSAAATPTP